MFKGVKTFGKFYEMIKEDKSKQYLVEDEKNLDILLKHILCPICKKNKNILFTIDHHTGSEEHQLGEEYHDSDLFDQNTSCFNSLPEFLRNLKFHKKQKIKYILRALPNEISGGIATSLIFSAWNAAVYVNQISDEQIMRAERQKNYQKIVQQIVNKYQGIYFNNELFVIEKK